VSWKDRFEWNGREGDRKALWNLKPGIGNTEENDEKSQKRLELSATRL
jgi:hypothetical protein